ncbi:Chaperone protein dnaJ [Verticillium dahliae VDG1]|nr:Chaperone protein dnaJ [Verticillium dahliae VDG1]
MAPSKLFPWFPHARSPIIINAPMMITANAALATEVTKAGGIGFIGAGFDLSAASAETGQLKDLANGLTEARGVVMGTRFIATPEAGFAEEYKALVVKTTDGGVSTWKTPFHDRLAANGLWKPGFDGRAIVGDIHREHMKGGVTVEESRERLKTGWSVEEAKFMVGKWAGAGVGLVKEIKPASEVVTEAREEARKIIRELAEGL